MAGEAVHFSYTSDRRSDRQRAPWVVPEAEEAQEEALVSAAGLRRVLASPPVPFRFGDELVVSCCPT